MNESRAFAESLVALSYADLSKRAIDRAKELILDQLGIQLAVSTMPWSIAAYRYVREFGGPSESTIVNYGDRVKAENAAFANAAFGHGFELDDTDARGSVHPGCIIVPTAIAVGEREMVDGKNLLLAVISGYEAMCRVARSVAPSLANRGFHCAAVAGTFGAAVAAGKLLRFDNPLMLNAFSIAGSHSSGLGEFTQTGGSIKRAHAGMAAFGGIRAALLARAGLTGPPTVLEGKKGFWHAFSDEHRVDELVAGFGTDFVVEGIALKRYCCCFQIQAPIEATSKIIREHAVKPRDIDEIVMGTNEHAMIVVGAIREPEDITAAQFSATFSLATCVVKGGNGFREYSQDNLRDPAVLEMAKRIRLEVDDEVDAAFPAKRPIRMTVKLKSGIKYEQWLAGPKGTPENPMTYDEVKDKFRGLATVVLPREKAEKIIDTVDELDSLDNISSLSRLLVS